MYLKTKAANSENERTAIKRLAGWSTRESSTVLTQSPAGEQLLTAGGVSGGGYEPRRRHKHWIIVFIVL